MYQLLYFSSLFLCGNRAPFLTASSCVEATRILFLLLVIVWQQQELFSYCWFLCGSSNDSFLTAGSCVVAARLLFLLLVLVWQQQDLFSYYWFLCDNNKVSFFSCLVSWVGEMLDWNLKWMCMNDEVLKLSGK